MEPQSEDADYETRLDMIRQVVGDTRFALGVQLIDAAQDPLEVGAALCRVAQAALVACADAATHEFEQAHGRIPDGGLAVLTGNLAPDGCIVKTAGVDESILKFAGPTRVFESQDAAVQTILANQILAGDVAVIRYEGPRGGPGTNWENPPGWRGGPGASPDRHWGVFRDRDNNPPGWRGGPGTNWENPPGWRGGPGASPDRYGRCR